MSLGGDIERGVTSHRGFWGGGGSSCSEIPRGRDFGALVVMQLMSLFSPYHPCTALGDGLYLINLGAARS
jgi:hypothetical protein